LKHLDRLTNEGFASAFNEFKNVNHGGLISVDLTKCIELSDEAVYELLKHSCHTLVELSLNSLDRMTKEFLLQICTDDFHPSKQSLKRRIEEEASEEKFYEQITLPLLTTFDFGFVRAVDDEVLLHIGELCPKLSILEVYGDNRCTSRAKFREGILVIGRQNDEI
jgi:DNA repair protein RAD7